MYLGEGSSTLRLIDVGKPEAPVELESYDTHQNITDMAIAGDHLYIATSDSGMMIYHISNPSNIERVGLYQGRFSWVREVNKPIEKYSSIFIKGNYAYVKGNWLYVINVSDPTNPVVAGYDYYVYTPLSSRVDLKMIGSEKLERSEVVSASPNPVSSTFELVYRNANKTTNYENELTLYNRNGKSSTSYFRACRKRREPTAFVTMRLNCLPVRTG